MYQVTNKILEGQLKHLCKLLKLPYGHYIKVKEGKGTLGVNKDMDTIPNGLDFSFAYGGVSVHQIAGTQGKTWTKDFFMSGYMKKKELYYVINAAIHMIYNIQALEKPQETLGCVTPNTITEIPNTIENK